MHQKVGVREKSASLTLAALALSGFILSPEYKLYSIHDAQNNVDLGAHVELRGYVRKNERIYDLLPTKEARDSREINECISLAISPRQMKTIDRNMAGRKMSMKGILSIDPSVASGETMHNVRINGRRWYGRSCLGGKVLIVSALATDR